MEHVLELTYDCTLYIYLAHIIHPFFPQEEHATRLLEQILIAVEYTFHIAKK